jgi:hypothetical protein
VRVFTRTAFIASSAPALLARAMLARVSLHDAKHLSLLFAAWGWDEV